MNNFPFYMVCVWLFVIVGRPQDIFDWLKVIHPGDIAAGLAIGSFFLTGARRGSRSFSPELKLFLALFLIAIVCTPFGYYPKRSIGHLWGFFGKIFILLFLISNLVNTEKRVKTLVNTIILSGFVMAVAAIIGKASQAGRIQVGSTYDPNDLAMVMVIALPIALIEIVQSRSRSWKVFCLVSSILFLATIIATQSRGGLLGLLVIAVMFFFMRGMPIPKGKILILLALLATLFYVNLSPQYKERIQTIFEQRFSDMQAGSGRILIWRRALVIARDNPFLGVGPDCFMSAYGDYIEKGKFPEPLYEEGDWSGWQTAHNSYLLVLTELGIFGFVIYLAIVMGSFRNLNRLAKRPISDDTSINFGPLATGLKISLSAFLICAFFLSQAYNVVPFLYYVLSGQIIRMVAAQEEEKTSRT
ncbi:MAG: O-antigen ligase family protein [Deltaproteobacteria bacterium]|nr:O-antigen ligase family protein [Deltaproteobacteria bacterium]